MEREPFKLDEQVKGNWKLLESAFKSPWTSVVYDIDGILIDSATPVFKDFKNRKGISADPKDADRWDYLTQLAISNGLSQEEIDTAEDGWFDPKILELATKYSHIGPVVDQTISLFGSERNYVLTSREPELDIITFESIRTEFPTIFVGNIFIRSNASEKSTEFKVKELVEIAKHSSYAVFIDDATLNIKAVLEAKIKNCLAIHIPLGVIRPHMEHPNLMTMGRFPTPTQDLYALRAAIDRVVSNDVPTAV